MTTIYTGQNVAKDCIVGDRNINRYAIFNGLNRPRVIDSGMTVSILGYEVPVITSITSVVTAGSLENGKWYSYKAVYASAKHPRPVAVADGSLNYTRGNPSALFSRLSSFGNSSMSVVVPRNDNVSVTHILLYRSLGAATQAEAEVGPFYYVAQGSNPATPTATIVDGTADTAIGMQVETDNFYPQSWRYAVAAQSYI